MNNNEIFDEEFQLLDHIPLGVCLIKNDFTLLFWNRYLENYTGITKKNIIGTDLLEVFPNLNSPKYISRLQNIFLGGPPVIFSSQLHKYFFPVKNENNEFRIQNTIVSSLRNKHMNGYYALITIEDVTELTNRIQDYRLMRDKAFKEVESRKQAEYLLANEKERLSVTLRSIADSIITTDINYNVTFLNPAAERLTGYTNSEAYGKKLTKILKAFDETSKAPIDYLNITGNGSIKNIVLPLFFILQTKNLIEILTDCSISPIKDHQGEIIGFVLILEDISKKRKLLEDLQQAKTMETVGILAAGLAHNFNNLLTTILGYTDLLRPSIENNEAELRKLNAIERAGFRARDLAQRLITLAKGGDPIKEIYQINLVIFEVTKLLKAESGIISNYITPEEVLYAKIDERQLKTALTEIIINAYEALSEKEDKEILIKVEKVNAAAEEQLAGKQGDYIKITISDNGIGISESDMKYIFDPFFTTKFNNKGLGLTISYSIIKKMDGILSFTSTEFAGSSFYIYLPAH
jgi:two-component system, cell cycle sensor histidine kinase and response regulator CckA